MKVSVIISNYNYGQYLPAAIASVLAQTYQNFEIIVVDDGSTDNSREVLTQLQQQALDKIKPIFQANQGQGAAFNTAFDVSTGDIIAFLDADDTWKPEKLQQIVQVFQQSDAVGVMHVLEQVDAEGNPLPAKPARPLPTGNIATTMISTGNACWFPPTSGLSYRRSVLKKVLPMDTTKWRLCADGCLVYCTAFLGNITSLNDALGSYRLHGANNYCTLKQPSVAAVTKTLAGIEMTNQYLNEFLEEIGYPGRVDLSRNLQYRRTRFYHNGQWNTKEVAAICGIILTWCLYTWQERLYFLGRFLLKSTSFIVYPIRSIEKTTS